MAYKKSSKSALFVIHLQTPFLWLCHTRGMTAKLQQGQRKRPTQTERGSAIRSNVTHPPASPHSNALFRAKRLEPRWQPSAPKQSEGGSAAATPLSPAQHIPELSRPLARTIRHSSFVIRHLHSIGRPSPGFVIHLPKCPPVCVIQPVIRK